ncbi:hypothetical protein [Anaplasma phagocytophilum]|nr:hypothetical protein [Anaplasma phagocytophilum]
MLYRAALMGSVFSFVLSLGVVLGVFTYRYGVKAIFSHYKSHLDFDNRF